MDKKTTGRKTTSSTSRRAIGNSSTDDPDFDRGKDNKNGLLFNAKSLEKRALNQQTATSPEKKRQSRPAKPNRATTNKADKADKTELVYDVPDLSALLNEVQAVYGEITKLESQCQRDYEAVKDYTFTDSDWQDMLRHYERLMERYHDFIFLAYHPSGNNVVRNLVKKYKIPLRMWNKGLFKFLDLLRPHLPASQEMMTRFTFSSFGLLSMLTEPPYESRNMCMEALGELARFQMQMPNGSEFNNWRRIAQFWYYKAFTRSPGLGRLYHHCAVVCLVNVDSLFYFCKSLDSMVPFDQARDTMKTLFKSVTDHDNLAQSAFVKLHHCIFEGNNEPKGVENWMSILKNGVLTCHDLKRRSAILAIINIESLLGYGQGKNQIATVLMANQPEAGSQPVVNVEPLALRVSVECLEWHLTDWSNETLPHLVVWVHFLVALEHAGYDYSGWNLPLPLMIKVLNQCLELTYQELESDLGDEYKGELSRVLGRWKKVNHAQFDRLSVICEEYESQVHIPSVKQRPFPEEIALLGLTWPRPNLMDRHFVADLEMKVLTESIPGFSEEPYLVKYRPVRLVELALNLVHSTSWLKLGSCGFYLHGEFVDQDTDSSCGADLSTALTMTEITEEDCDYEVFGTDSWLHDIERIEQCPNPAVSKPQLCELYMLAQTDPNAQRATRTIIQGLDRGRVHFFDQDGTKIIVDPDSIVNGSYPDCTIDEFVTNLRSQFRVKYSHCP